MNKDTADFVRSLLGALIGLAPGGAPVASIAGPILRKLIHEDSEEALKIDVAIRHKAKALLAHFVAIEEAGYVNPGTGHSAAHDLVQIVGRANVTPALLIELKLDRDALWSYFKQVGAPELTAASQGRQGLVIDGLREITDLVLDLAPKLSSIQALFMSKVLKGLS